MKVLQDYWNCDIKNWEVCNENSLREEVMKFPKVENKFGPYKLLKILGKRFWKFQWELFWKKEILKWDFEFCRQK